VLETRVFPQSIYATRFKLLQSMFINSLRGIKYYHGLPTHIFFPVLCDDNNMRRSMRRSSGKGVVVLNSIDMDEHNNLEL